MKREILFKAQRDDGKGWVFGNLLNLSTIGKVGKELSYYEYSTVDPDTVCQYTGLKDNNGVKIFEGDVVNCRIPMEEDGLHPCTVEFDEEGQWVFVNNRLDIADAFGLVEVFNVTGNIHDND